MIVGPTGNHRKCPCCPRGHRRHPCPFASPPPMRLYRIDNERLRSPISGTAEPSSSPTVPRLVANDCQRRKPAANFPARLGGRHLLSPAGRAPTVNPQSGVESGCWAHHTEPPPIATLHVSRARLQHNGSRVVYADLIYNTLHIVSSLFVRENGLLLRRRVTSQEALLPT